MKTVGKRLNALFLICLLNSTIAQSQIAGIVVFSDHSGRYVMNQFNDSLLFIRPENDEEFGNYYLGKYKISNDTLYVNEVLDAVLISQELSTSASSLIAKDSIQINYFQGDYLIAAGQYTFDTLNFIINKRTFAAKKKDEFLSPYFISIQRPKEKQLSLNLSICELPNCLFKLKLKKQHNLIEIKEYFITSMPSFIDKNFIAGISNSIEIDGKRYNLKISLDY